MLAYAGKCGSLSLLTNIIKVGRQAACKLFLGTQVHREVEKQSN